MGLKQFLMLAALALAAVLAQVWLSWREMEYCLTQATMSAYYSIVVIGLCIVMGYAGQVSLGHGAFFAIGGYTSAVLTTCDLSRFQNSAWAALLTRAHMLVPREDLFGGKLLSVSPWTAFIAAMAVTCATAYLIGYPALRLKGHYLAMATLGFGIIVYKIVLGSAITGGADGITNVPEWTIVPGIVITGKSAARVMNFYVAIGMVLVLLALLLNLVKSRVGRALLAIHDRETAANAIGIDTASFKLRAFVLSAMLAAIAGVFLTHFSGGISPSEASSFKSVRYVALAAAGGFGNLWGAAIVSNIINFLSLRDWFGSYDNAVFGGILLVIMTIAPEGPFKLAGQYGTAVINRVRARLYHERNAS